MDAGAGSGEEHLADGVEKYVDEVGVLGGGEYGVLDGKRVAADTASREVR